MIPWTVDAYDAAGNTVAASSGFGAEIDWSWDAALLPAGSYSYAIRAGADVTPAVGAIGGGGEAALAIAGLATDPETVSPNADGIADETTITYTLTVPANVTIKVRDGLGTEVATIANKAWKRAAEHAVRFDAAALPDGIYQVEVAAVATGGREAAVTTQVAVTRTLGSVQAARPAFSPNGDGKADRIAFRFALAASADVRIRISRTVSGSRRRSEARSDRVFAGWSGRREAGRPAPRRELRGRRRGDRRGRDVDHRGAVQLRHPSAQRADRAAVPAQDRGERAGPAHHALRSAEPDA